MHITLELAVLLLGIAFIAGFLDTLAGGGGLLSLPALLLTGIHPLTALGTNKLQGTAGTASATFAVLKARKVSWPSVRWLMLNAFIGSALGTIAVQFINIDALSFIIPAVLLIMGLYFLFSPRLGEYQSEAKLSAPLYSKIIVPIIGWYDGMFGPGTGSFFALAGVSLRGHPLIEATAIAKTLNFSTNIASLIIFLFAGQIAWAAGLIMVLGQLAGARLAAKYLFSIRPQVLRPIIVCMCFGMLIKYSIQANWFG